MIYWTPLKLSKFINLIQNLGLIHILEEALKDTSFLETTMIQMSLQLRINLQANKIERRIKVF